MEMKTFFLLALGNIVRSPINILNKQAYMHQTISFNERRVEYRFVFDQIASSATNSVLDVGTGTTALPALIRNCGINVTAIDNVRDFWPRGMFNQHCFVLDQDILNPKLDCTFDLITCISVLEHIKDFDKAVKEMANLLKPEGLLVLSFPYCENVYLENVYLRNFSDAYGLNMPFICQVFSRIEINNWLEKYDLSIMAQEYWQFYTGEFWSEGTPVFPPKKVGKNETHHLSCLALTKNLNSLK
jgi:ubiquinone/menaquinone biosynthesis C-methylase UbiE